MKFCLSALLLCLLVSIPFAASAGEAEPDEQDYQSEAVLPVYEVGIVTDGDTEKDRQTLNLFKKEIQTMAEGEFIVKFPASMMLSGNDTAEGARKSLSWLLQNSNTDLVLALGTIVSSEVMRRHNFSKPVVASYVVDSVIRSLPKQQVISDIPNLTYISSMFYLNAGVQTFKKIVPFNNLAIILDQREVDEIPEVSKGVRTLANEHTMTVNMVKGGMSAQDILQAIPAETKAVMVGPLYHLPDDEFRKLAAGLIARHLPSYSVWSLHQVERGLLATDVPKDMQENLARRTAVSIQDILLGEAASSLDVSFSRGHELTVNMATARALDVYPGLAVMTGANVLNEQRVDIKRHLTLQEAVNEALQANLDLSSAELKVKAGVFAVKEARSPLLPQIGVGTGARAIDEDRAGFSVGSNPERAWTGTASGSQQLYSEQSWAGYSVEQHNQTGRMMERDGVRLDVILQSSVSYLNVLRAKTIEQLQKDNLKLTQANLKRARIRMSTGVAGPDEVYRWETKFSSDRIKVLTAESRTLDAMEAMNRVLNRPLQELFIAEETDLSDPLLIAGDKFFFQLMNNPKNLRGFRNFALQEALVMRPELKRFDAAIAAQARIKTANQRSYWLPDFSLEGRVDQYFAEDGVGQRGDIADGLDDTDWQVGVFARLPIFEGGRKGAALDRSQQELARLRIDRRALAERIGQDMLRALNKTRASYPGISLSREAADSAGRNLQLITDSYIQGIKSIIELLDAQNQALSADQAAANAVYDFLIDLMGVQRAMGEFILFLPDEQRQNWLQRAEQYLQQAPKTAVFN